MTDSHAPSPTFLLCDGRVHPGAEVLHASAVAVEGRAVLILGASGSGKSALALQLMALGATLVADDCTCVWPDDGRVMAAAPDAIRGRIEARNVGILNAAACGPMPVALVVDMDHSETDRLPPHRSHALLGQSLPLLHKCDIGYFFAAILQYLRGGRSD